MRTRSFRKVTPLLLLALLASLAPIYGVGTPGDGDSFKVNGQRIRLFGIDAPEFDQICQRNGTDWQCGQAAAESLSRLVVGKEVRCLTTGRDQYDRALARCTVGTLDVNRFMVANGFAVAFRRYSYDYVSTEETAKANRRGIWAGTFTMPSEVRAADRTASQPRISSRRDVARSMPLVVRSTAVDGETNSSCRIKGNRNRRGQWIYHVPGMPYYDRTRAEDLFCSEAAARAAGYRRAIVN
ncbi:thermonuclease family protein [Sphingomonas sp. LY160]|uniref:thermonuclease family protein n=1 Tax=Sphingomonas sp. LY160 TaxID=3095342 RepID=UPI003A1003E6